MFHCAVKVQKSVEALLHFHTSKLQKGTSGNRRWSSSLPLEQGFLTEDLYGWGFHINIYAFRYQKLHQCVNPQKMRIFKSYGERFRMKILKKKKKNEDFYWPKSPGNYNFQMWIFHDFIENWWGITKDLIAKHDLSEQSHPFFIFFWNAQTTWNSDYIKCTLTHHCKVIICKMHYQYTHESQCGMQCLQPFMILFHQMSICSLNDTSKV